MSNHNQNVALSILNEMKQKGEITETDFKKMTKNLKKQNKKANKLEKGLRKIAFLKMNETMTKTEVMGEVNITFDYTQKGFFRFFEYLRKINGNDFYLDENLLDCLLQLKEKAQNIKLNNDFHVFAKKNYRFSNKRLPFLRILDVHIKNHFFKNGLKKLDEKTIRLNFFIENQKNNFKHYDLNFAIELYKKALSCLMEEDETMSFEEMPEINIELEKLFNFSYFCKLMFGLLTLSEIRKTFNLTEEKVTLDEIYFLENFIVELYFVNAEMNEVELEQYIPLFSLKEDNSVDFIFNKEIVEDHDLLNQFKNLFNKK